MNAVRLEAVLGAILGLVGLQAYAGDAKAGNDASSAGKPSQVVIKTKSSSVREQSSTHKSSAHADKQTTTPAAGGCCASKGDK